MIKKSKEHLNSVNESYFEHMNIASNVGFKMLSGGYGTYKRYSSRYI